MLVKSYRVISLLNCMDKVLKKVIVKQMSELLKKILKLYQSQMEAWKERYAIDMVVSLVYEVKQK